MSYRSHLNWMHFTSSPLLGMTGELLTRRPLIFIILKIGFFWLFRSGFLPQCFASAEPCILNQNINIPYKLVGRLETPFLSTYLYNIHENDKIFVDVRKKIPVQRYGTLNGKTRFVVYRSLGMVLRWFRQTSWFLLQYNTTKPFLYAISPEIITILLCASLILQRWWIGI